MTALACLRIVIDPERVSAGGDALAHMVSRVVTAYLETRWLWPRRFGEIAPFAYLLADPKASQVDAQELVKLSEALDGRGNTWVKTASTAADIDKQIADTRELIKLCK